MVRQKDKVEFGVTRKCRGRASRLYSICKSQRGYRINGGPSYHWVGAVIAARNRMMECRKTQRRFDRRRMEKHADEKQAALATFRYREESMSTGYACCCVQAEYR